MENLFFLALELFLGGVILGLERHKMLPEWVQLISIGVVGMVACAAFRLTTPAMAEGMWTALKSIAPFALVAGYLVAETHAHYLARKGTRRAFAEVRGDVARLRAATPLFATEQSRLMRSHLELSVLVAPSLLRPGNRLHSANGRLFLDLTRDGRLRLCSGSEDAPEVEWRVGRRWWSTCADAALAIQSDGNLVIYDEADPSRRVVWRSRTDLGAGRFFLAVQDDGNVVMYCGIGLDAPAFPIWSRRSGRLVSRR